jgi:hypothetical protein
MSFVFAVTLLYVLHAPLLLLVTGPIASGLRGTAAEAVVWPAASQRPAIPRLAPALEPRPLRGMARTASSAPSPLRI